MAQQNPIGPYSLDEDIAAEEAAYWATVDVLCDVEIAMEAMFEHDQSCHQEHVRCAEAHYRAADHAAHVHTYYEVGYPF